MSRQRFDLTANPLATPTTRRTVLRGLLGGSAGAWAGARLAGAPSSVAAQATPSPVAGLAQTPLGEQLAWLLAAINGGGTALTAADITTHMAPPLLAAIPPAQLIGFIQSLAKGYGTLTLQGVTRPPTATQAVALVRAAVGLQLALPLRVEDAAPHRITGVNVDPVPTADGTPLQPLSSTGVAEATAPLVAIDGRRLYRDDVASGAPPVVLEAGLGDCAAPWAGIIPAVAAVTRVVSYDRPNTRAGASDPAPTPRTAADVVTDLHALLSKAAVPGPYVLVGHSFGGLIVRLYASTYPAAVAGLVLVDASHEEQDERRRALVSPALFAAEQQAVKSNPEGIDLAASFAQMRAARVRTPLHPMPLVVLSAGQPDPAGFPPGWPMATEARLWNELQTDLAGLVPGGRHIVAEKSTHYIMQSQPDLVAAAIRAVVAAVRNPASWATPVAATPTS